MCAVVTARTRGPASFTGKSYSPLNPDMCIKDRNRCRAKTAAAIRAGKIVRSLTCEACGSAARTEIGRNGQIQVHHRDYRDPFDIMWLCGKCHWTEHSRIAEAANFGVMKRRGGAA